jgi:hypothetical protein
MLGEVFAHDLAHIVVSFLWGRVEFSLRLVKCWLAECPALPSTSWRRFRCARIRLVGRFAGYGAQGIIGRRHLLFGRHCFSPDAS